MFGAGPSWRRSTDVLITVAYSESVHRPPLYVLVDRNTWSVAEYFAAILQDAHAAVVVGEASGGAGCGYTEGAESRRCSAILKQE
jgi:C-terminal processing protease CtpA/Prc